MDTSSVLLSPAVWGVLGSLLTGIITYRTAVRKNTTDYAIQREAYVDAQLKNLLETYRSELGSLKCEIKELTEKNQQLVEEVIGLKVKITEMEGIQHEKQTSKTDRSEKVNLS